MRFVRHAIKEFWLPLCAALAWTGWNILRRTDEAWSFTHCVNIFAPSFFLASWLVGQYFRIKKQTSVEDNFDQIQKGVTSLLVELETKTKDLVGQITGGESFCYVMIGAMPADTNAGLLMVVHQGKHPMYEVKARVTDVDAFGNLIETIKREKSDLTYERVMQSDRNLDFGSLIPGHAISTGERWNLGETRSSRSFNIFFTARNGSFTQLLRFKKVGRHWLQATKVERGGTIYEDIQPEFPRNDKGGVDW